MLTVLEHLPEGLLDVPARELDRVLAGPTLIHLPGRRPDPLFVSILLHGNEDVGLAAVQGLLARHAGRELPRALSLFVGNVAAARAGLRALPGQPDYNRVWPGAEDGGTPEHAMMAQVTEAMRARGVFASVDLHNNTGLNPHYACVNRLDARSLQLASLFSRTVVYFLRPRGVQSWAFSQFCPSVTCECGKTGDASGVAHASAFLDACLHLAEIPAHPVRDGDIHLFHTVATVKVPEACSIGFGAAAADLVFPAELDHLNFRELPAGTLLARRPGGADAGLEVWDERGRQVAGDFLAQAGDEIRLARPLMPSMLTLNEAVIRQDCLCYFMERYPLPR